jgi:hypothetical protein
VGTVVRGCRVVTGDLFGSGIQISDSFGSTVIGNDLLGHTHLLSSIQIIDADNVIVVNNRMMNAISGIRCFDNGGQSPAPSTGVYRDNVTIDVLYPYDAGTDVGNNH